LEEPKKSIVLSTVEEAVECGSTDKGKLKNARGKYMND